MQWAPEVVRPSLVGDAGHEEAEHRRLIVADTRGLTAALSASVPTASYCDVNTSVSSSTSVSVSGMAQSVTPLVRGALDIQGVLYVAELDPGQFTVRIVNGAAVLWTATIQNQGAALRVSGGVSQLSRWLLPIGGPGLLDATERTTYSLDVYIAAPEGSYQVLTGTGKESWLSVGLRPLFGG